MDSFNNMTRDEQRELITAYIDNECSKEEKSILEERLKSDDSLRKLYQEEKQTKELLQTRLERYKAPTSLKQKIPEILSVENSINSRFKPTPFLGEKNSDEQTDIPLTPKNYSFSKYTSYSPLTENRGFGSIISIAVVLLVMLGFGYFQVQNSEEESASGSAQPIRLEEVVYDHFNRHNAQMIKPTISSVSRSETQKQLAGKYNLDIAIPSIKNTDFKGVVYSDFYGDMKAPLLEYRCTNSGEVIYIFAFKVEDIEGIKNIKRDNKAKDRCRDKNDYHITDFNDKQVVSWKWDNIWYTAISNQKGNLLASRVAPLN